MVDGCKSRDFLEELVEEVCGESGDHGRYWWLIGEDNVLGIGLEFVVRIATVSLGTFAISGPADNSRQ